MEKKKILISCNRTLNLGGIERALIKFLKAIDRDSYNVTLVLHDNKGVLYSDIDLTGIEVYFTDKCNARLQLQDDVKHIRVLALARSFYYRAMLRVDKDWYANIMYSYKIIQKQINIPGQFDLALSFTTDYSDLSIITKADAKKKACMVHGDPRLSRKHAKLNDHLLCKLDKVYCVSEDIKHHFITMHPKCEDKMDVFYNIILPQEIIVLSEEKCPDKLAVKTANLLCTVGRLDRVKGQQLIPEVASLLKKNKLHFDWYIIGDGDTKEEIAQKCVDFDVEDEVHLLGARKNPYPYMKHCLIYVQPSFSEAFCTTTMEAKILHKPIVTTDAPGMREQFVSGENGLIVDAMTPEALFEGIKTLLDHPELQQKFIDNLSKETWDNSKELQKLYDFIES